jgi:aspartyl protease family protein
VEFLVDTGATATAISASLARELGLQSDGQVQSMTAAGAAVGEAVRADVELRGGIRAERLRIVALPGLGERPLLGMNVLGRLRLQQHDGVLRIEPAARGD